MTASDGIHDTLVTDDHGTVLFRRGAVPSGTGTNLGNDRLVKAMLAKDTGSGAFRHHAYTWTTPPLSRGEIHVAVGAKR